MLLLIPLSYKNEFIKFVSLCCNAKQNFALFISLQEFLSARVSLYRRMCNADMGGGGSLNVFFLIYTRENLFSVNALSRDFEILKHEGMKRLISDTSDEVVSRLLRRLSGLCLVSNEIVDASCDAIYRNGLLALANQIAKGESNQILRN